MFCSIPPILLEIFMVCYLFGYIHDQVIWNLLLFLNVDLACTSYAFLKNHLQVTSRACIWKKISFYVIYN